VIQDFFPIQSSLPRSVFDNPFLAAFHGLETMKEISRNFIGASCSRFTMLITNKAQYTCHKTFIWLRLSLTCCTYVLGGEGATMIFSFDKSTSLEGESEKKSQDDQGGGASKK